MAIALVTGGNKGIGFETAKGLVQAGLKVYIGARDRDKGEKAARELGAHFLPLDVASEVSIQAAVEQLSKKEGALDVLVNNAGISVGAYPPSTATKESMRTTFDTNYFGVVAVTQAFLPLLRKGQKKCIVNVSSELGSISLHGVPEWHYHAVNNLSYNSSKAALNMFTVLLAKELRGEGFRVNSVNPGYVATDLNAHSGPGTAEDGARITIDTVINGSGTGMFLTRGGQLLW